jgi:WD40 repeat protein
MPDLVFLSYTSELANYPEGGSFRQKAEEAVRRAGDAVSDMAYFGARDEQPARYCAEMVERCDIYVALIGHRYGSPVADRPDISYVQLEFETATNRGIPRIVLMLDEDAPLPYRLMMDDPPDLMSRQRGFRKKLQQLGLTTDEFRTPEELQTKLFQALTELKHAPARGARTTPVSTDSSWRTHVNYSQLALEQQLSGAGKELYSVALSPDKGLVAAGSESEVLIWHRDNPAQPEVVEGYGRYVYSVAFSADGATLASGDEDGGVRVLDVASGEFVWAQEQNGEGHTEGVYSVAFSPDGQFVASGSYDRQVKLWNAGNGQLRDARAQSGRIASVAFDRNSRLLATGSHDNSVSVWNLRTGESKHLDGSTSSVESVAFSPVADLLAAGGLDKMVRVWNVNTSREEWVGRGHEYLVRSVAFSPDGATVASASWDKTVRLWDADAGNCIHKVPWDRKHLPYHTDWIWAVAFSPDGMLLASVGSDGKVILWRVQNPGETMPGRHTR